MYDKGWLDNSIQRLNEVLKPRDCVAVLRLGAAASKDEVRDCEDRISVPLPRSYKELLESSNGLTLRVHPIGKEHIVEHWYYQVRIPSAAECTDLTLRLRRYVADEVTWERPGFHEAAVTFVTRMIALDAANDMIIAFHAAQGDPVFMMDVSDYSNADSPYIRIASSLHDHLRRSIEHMMAEDGSFQYWY